MTAVIARDELRCALGSVTLVDALLPGPYGLRHLPGAVKRRRRGLRRLRPRGAGGPRRAIERPRAVTLELSDLARGPIALLFEGFPRAGADISIFATRAPPGHPA